MQAKSKAGVGADRARFDILGINTPVIRLADNLDQVVNRPALSSVVPMAGRARLFKTGKRSLRTTGKASLTRR